MSFIIVLQRKHLKFILEGFYYKIVENLDESSKKSQAYGLAFRICLNP